MRSPSAPKTRQPLRALAASAFAACLCCAGTTDIANAQDDRRGFYIGIDTGVARSAPLNLSVSAVTAPTKCDILMYEDPAMAPSDAPECMVDEPRELSSDKFSPAAGFAGGVSMGYALRALRFELAYRIQGYGSDRSLIVGSAANQSVVSKESEWSSAYPPVEIVSGYRAHHVFANVRYAFENDSPWTPSVGAGAGVSHSSLNYSRRLLRKSLAEGYRDVEPPTTLADRPIRAAGTFSMLDAAVSETILGFQALAGVEYALGERAALGITAHWTRFGTLRQEVTWSIIRSHAPVRSDGVTPFVGEVTIDHFASLSATLGMKYRF